MEDEEGTTVIDPPNDKLKTPKNRGESKKDLPKKKKKSPKPKEAWETVFQQAKALPHDQQTKLFNALNEERAQPIPKPDLSKIPLWEGKKKSKLTAIEWLDKHYGHLITTFRSDHNYIYRQDVKDHDPYLVERVSAEASKKGKKGQFYLPTITNQTDDKKEKLNLVVTEDGTRTVVALKQRDYRKSKTTLIISPQ